jgi:23S rRNA (guanosine2251-2'-O)-methyltransferase
MKEWIVGRNPIFETLRADKRQFFRLQVTQGGLEKGRLEEIIRLCSTKHIPVERLPRQRLDALGEGHQGVALEVNDYPYSDLPDILVRVNQSPDPAFLLILDALQDPQNLGTLLRTAEVVGVHGVILPLRHTVTVTPAVVSASSGASEHLHIAQANLAQAIDSLKKAGLWVVGLESSLSGQDPNQVRLDGPLALVVGSEGQGMRPLVRDSCDLLLRLPMRGKVESLNAAVAGSIVLYMAWQARGFLGAKY